MEHLYRAYEMLDDKLKELTRDGDVKTLADVEVIDKISHGMKSLKTIIAMCEQEEDGEYSERGGRSYERGGRRSYEGGQGGQGGRQGGSSYARGRGQNARRDSRGRYSSEGGGMRYSNRGYSRDDDRDEMVSQIRELMEDTQDTEIKQALRQAIQTLEM